MSVLNRNKGRAVPTPMPERVRGEVTQENQYDITGGGIEDESTQDSATEHIELGKYGSRFETNELASEREHAVVDYDDEYGPSGTGREDPLPAPYTRDDMDRDLQRFVEPAFRRMENSRNLANVWAPGTVDILSDGSPYCIAGADGFRKRIFIKSVVANTVAVVLSDQEAMPRAGTGSGAYYLGPGQEVIIEATGPVWVGGIITSPSVSTTVRITYYIERYAV